MMRPVLLAIEKGIGRAVLILLGFFFSLFVGLACRHYFLYLQCVWGSL